MTRRVGILTGTRADYGILLPILRALGESKELDPRLFVTGMHLSGEFGLTLDLIEDDGIHPDVVIRPPESDDTPEGMTRGVGQIVQQMVTPLRDESIDIFLLLGDRAEMLAGALVATYLRIPIAHIHGGERSGHVDEPVRHAISRLAHLHLTATEQSALRLRKMGEEEWRVHVVGAPRLDTILSRPHRSDKEILREHGMDPDKPLILVVQHPTSRDRKRAGSLLRHTLDAALSFEANLAAIYPNGDPGSQAIVRVLKKYARDHGFPVYKSLPEAAYLDLLSATSVLVGNSSSGIIEAPSLKVPAVNLGDRQMERERAQNVIDVPHTKQAIEEAIRRALHDDGFLRQVRRGESPYGDGRASDRIVQILQSTSIDDRLLDKHITF